MYGLWTDPFLIYMVMYTVQLQPHFQLYVYGNNLYTLYNKVFTET